MKSLSKYYKFGVLANDLGMNQMLHSLNKKVGGNNNYSPALFFKNPQRSPYTFQFPTFHYSEMFGFNGDVYITDWADLDFLSTLFVSGRKYFYIWDLNWLNNYEKYQTLLLKDISLITRSKTHHDLVRNCWGKHSIISENWEFLDGQHGV
jgi:hypothetical protein